MRGLRLLSLVTALALGPGLSLMARAAEQPADWDPALYMGVDEIRPGMTGTGRSVFRGTEIEEFDVEILGVLETATPRGDIILARLSGKGLEKSGVVAGMSGSPIYVDGRLIGALAYGWSFSSEPITGITPIAEMLALGDRAAASGPPGASGRSAVPWDRLWEARGAEALDLLTAGGESPPSGWAPLRVPVALGGFDEASAAEAARLLSGYGFTTVQGGGAGSDPEGTFPPLEPGGAVGVELVRGDAQIAAVGTVTWTDRDRVLAFGHRMMGRGPAAYPMGPARILTILPRLSESFKIGVVGRPVGAVTRDYYPGVMGTVGAEAGMVPLSLRTRFGDREEDLRFEILEAENLTPALAGVVVMNAINSLGWDMGMATVRVTTTVTLADGRQVTAVDMNAGSSPPRDVAGEVSRLVGLIHGNPFRTVRISDIQVDAEVQEDIQAAFLELVSVPAGPHEPGSNVPVTLTFRDYRGATRTRTMSFPLPGDLAEGSYDLTACGAEADARREATRAPGRYQPTSFDRLLELLGEEDPYDTLVLRLHDPEPNPVVRGRELPGLPRSLKAPLLTPGVGGRASATTGSVAAVLRERLDRVLVGCREATIKVASRP